MKNTFKHEDVRGWTSHDVDWQALANEDFTTRASADVNWYIKIPVERKPETKSFPDALPSYGMMVMNVFS